jgi:ribosomal protein S19E (S16A)
MPTIAEPARLLLIIGEAAVYDKSEDQYKDFLTRMFNKGQPTKKREKTIDQIRALASILIEAALATNGGFRYEVSEAGIDWLTEVVQPTKPPKESVVEVPEDTSAQRKPLKIKPASVPADISDLPEDDPLVMNDKKNRKQVKAVSYHGREVFQALERAGGIIEPTGRRRSVTGEIKRLSDSTADIGVYWASIRQFEKAGWIKLENNIMTLTPKGRKIIALIKAYPDIVKEPEDKEIAAPTRTKIMEFILGETGAVFEPTTTAEVVENNLDDYCRWLRDPAPSTSLAAYMSSHLGLTEDVCQHRLIRLIDKAFVEVATSISYDDGFREIVTNVKLTRAGVLYALRTYHAMREAESVIDEAEVESVENLRDECVALAAELGYSDQLERLTRKPTDPSLFELTQEQFREVKREFENTVEQLRQGRPVRFNWRLVWFLTSKTDSEGSE